MQLYKISQTFKEILDKIIFVIMLAVITMMFVMVMWQVISRYFLQNPSVITEEVVRFGLIWLGLFGATYGFGSNKHISLNLIFDKFSQKVKCLVMLWQNLTIVIFTIVVMIMGGLQSLPFAAMQKSAILHLPLSYIYLAFPVSGTILLCYKIVHLIEWYHFRKDFLEYKK